MESTSLNFSCRDLDYFGFVYVGRWYNMHCIDGATKRNGTWSNNRSAKVFVVVVVVVVVVVAAAAAATVVVGCSVANG